MTVTTLTTKIAASADAIHVPLDRCGADWVLRKQVGIVAQKSHLLERHTGLGVR